jgi:hypothetical protein
MVRKLEEILKDLKNRVHRKDNPVETITVESADLTAIGEGVLAIALAKCELAPQGSATLFHSREKMDLGKWVLEKLFEGQVTIIPSFNQTLRGFCVITYENGADDRIKI